MSAILVYRILIFLRGAWLLTEWLLGWGTFSYATTFRWEHPYVHLAAQTISVGFWLAILTGLLFFQRWARLIFVLLLAVALLSIPFRVHHYSLSSPPPFFAPNETIMLLLTGAIVAMSFLPPVHGCFSAKEA